eukprot:superscaffoldBa00003159_g16264
MKDYKVTHKENVDAVEETVNVDPKGSLAFLDLGVKMENLEDKDNLDIGVLMDRRETQADRENQAQLETREGPRGPPGVKGMTECELITYIRDNCGQSKCPAYPTELVFGLDMSKDVARAAFERQRTALLSLLEDISIAESDCPTGARVAVVGYNDQTKYLIRFQDYRHKTQLNDSVINITLERTSDRHLGAAMRFVGQNVFKRSRAGALMRKVAVFFSNGQTQNINDIISAVMEYRALNIIPVVISLSGDPDVRRAMEVGLICQQSSVAS